jgi:hypothetical protein
MSKSHKARHGMHCKQGKDNILESRHQKKANTDRKRRTHRALRRTGKLTRKRGSWSFHKMAVPPIEE